MPATGSFAEGAAVPRVTQFRLSSLCRGPALFLQPDQGAALACGGAAALIATAGWPSTLVSVVARGARDLDGLPPWDAEPFGRIDDVVTLRRAEELCAAAVLGCGTRQFGLPMAEPPGGGLIHARHVGTQSSDLARGIALRVLAMQDWQDGTQVFVPMAIGKSAVHRVLFEAGRTLAACGVRVWAYEDLPGAAIAPQSADLWLAQCAGALGAQLLLAIDTVLPRKLDAVACHASDLSVAIPSVRHLRAAVAGHAWALGREAQHACERYWPVLG